MQSNQLSSLLYRYFTQTGEVAIPGIGQLNYAKTNAVNDFVMKEIRPASVTVDFNSGDKMVDDKQCLYLSKQTGVSESNLKHELVLLGEELHQRLHQEKKLEWMGVGSFFVGENGEIQFQSKSSQVSFFKPLHYQHVIRKDAVYEMRVGEDQRSTVEMENFFEEQRSLAENNKWKKGALILVGVLAVALVIRYSKGSFSLLDGRFNKIEFNVAQSTYKLI